MKKFYNKIIFKSKKLLVKKMALVFIKGFIAMIPGALISDSAAQITCNPVYVNVQVCTGNSINDVTENNLPARFPIVFKTTGCTTLAANATSPTNDNTTISFVKAAQKSNTIKISATVSEPTTVLDDVSRLADKLNYNSFGHNVSRSKNLATKIYQWQEVRLNYDEIKKSVSIYA